jgi:8-oxo-dGTP pyrophosphatase MutT (NUDIX family)
MCGIIPYFNKNIMATSLKWNDSNKINDTHASLEVKQVYGWIITKDGHLVLVSKDNVKWQFPGGKPDVGESLEETLIREVLEETSLDISMMAKEFFGYYEVIPEDKSPFLQIRFLIFCDKKSEELELSVGKEDKNQVSEDTVKYVNTYTIEKALELIPWLGGTDEYKTFLKIYQNVTTEGL